MVLPLFRGRSIPLPGFLVVPFLLALLAGAVDARAQVVQDPTFLLSFGRGTVQTPYVFNFETGLAVNANTGDLWVPGVPIKRFDSDGNFILSLPDCGQCMGADVNLVNDDVYFAKPKAGTILHYTEAGAFVREFGAKGEGPGEFHFPNDVSIDSGRGELYTIDGERVQVFDLAGNYLREWGQVAPGPGGFSGGSGNYGIAFDPGSDTVFVSDSPNDRIQAFDRFGNFITDWNDNGGGIGPGQLRWARNIDVDSAGNVYEIDGDNERVQVFSPAGVYLSEFMGPHDLDAGPFHPRAIAINRATGERFVMAAYAQRIDKFDANDEYLFSFGDRERDGEVLWGPKGVAVAQLTGEVFVMDSFHFLVKRFTRTGAFLNQWGGSNRLDPQGDGRFGPFDANELFGQDRVAITTDNQGYPWTAGGGIHYTGDPFLNSTRRFTPEGDFLNGFHVDLPPTAIWNERIWSLAIDTDDRIYLSDAAGNRIRVHAQDGTLLQTIPLGAKPAGVAVRGDAIYVAIPSTQSIRRYTKAGALVTEWGAEGAGDGEFDLDTRSAIALDRDGNVVVADSFNHRLQFFDPDGNFLRTFGGPGRGEGKFTAPVGVTVARLTNTLYVADTGNDRIQAFALDGAPQCFNGEDDDGDGLVDEADPECSGPLDRENAGPICGLGPELALLLPGLLRARSRRRPGGGTGRRRPRA